jgi:hypothetical protein
MSPGKILFVCLLDIVVDLVLGGKTQKWVAKPAGAILGGLGAYRFDTTISEDDSMSYNSTLFFGT